MWASAVSSSFTKVKRVTEIKITILQKAGHRFQVTENLYVPILKSNDLNKSEQRIDEISNQELFIHVFLCDFFFPCIKSFGITFFNEFFWRNYCHFLLFNDTLSNWSFFTSSSGKKNLVEFWWFSFVSRVCDLCQTD